MLAIIPAISFVFLFLILAPTAKNGWRSAVLRSAIVWGLVLTAITEVLSLFKALTPAWVTAVWIVFSIAIFLIYQQSPWKYRKAQLNNFFDRAIKFLSNPYSRNYLLGIMFIVSMIGLIALVAPPNTNDSMGYHMPRVVHWIQNQSVAHYLTHYTAQLYLSPWSAFAILHLQVLGGGDRYANLVQFFSMIGSIIGVSLIAKQLGANVCGQMLAAVFCATIPMGILQASSTQNDYVVSFWLICLVYYVLLTLQNQGSKAYFLEIGISFGLAILTKPTAYIYAFPFLVWLLVSELKAEQGRFTKPIGKHLLLLAIPALLINLGHYLRNIELFHTPLGKSPHFINYTNQELSIPILLSNITRNISLHLATPSSSINKLLYDFINWLHSLLKIDINDPRTTGLDFQINSLINHEDLAGNTLHLALILLSTISFAFFLKRRSLPNSLLIIYVASIFICFLLFCALLTWTPFHSRLQLFMFVIAAPFIGTIISSIFRIRVVSFLASFLILTSMTWVFFNETRPLIANSQFLTEKQVENIFNTPRSDLYFMGQRYLKEPIMSAVEFVRN